MPDHEERDQEAAFIDRSHELEFASTRQDELRPSEALLGLVTGEQERCTDRVDDERQGGGDAPHGERDVIERGIKHEPKCTGVTAAMNNTEGDRWPGCARYRLTEEVSSATVIAYIVIQRLRNTTSGFADVDTRRSGAYLCALRRPGQLSRERR